MQYTNALGYQFSKLGIGTAQFGYKYGISNKTGQPTDQEVNCIISKAIENGINVIDTAYEYGSSEKIIGDILTEKKAKMIICTKLKKVLTVENKERIRKEIHRSVKTSLERLKISTIPIFFIHEPDSLLKFNGLILKELLKLKKAGSLQHIGISVYTPEEAKNALETSEIEAIQVPFNLFDQRFLRSNFFDNAKDQGVGIFTRSSYLQGLITMQIEDVPQHLASIIPYKRKLEFLSKENDMSTLELALKFVLGLKEINSVIVGIEKCKQMVENIEMCKSHPISNTLFNEILNEFDSIPERVIDPRKW